MERFPDEITLELPRPGGRHRKMSSASLFWWNWAGSTAGFLTGYVVSHWMGLL